MNYKKLFFPIGGGDELEERLYGAFLIAKTFNVKLDILKAGLKAGLKADGTAYKSYFMPKDLLDEINKVVDANYEIENQDFHTLFDNVLETLDMDESLIKCKIREGLRSELVEEESKFCDLVVAAAPPSGVTTATFETAVLKSGKPVLMFPRIMRKFSTESVIIGWNNSPEVSRALTSSIEILKQAKRVHLITSSEYVEDLTIMENVLEYLKEHGVEATYEVITTTRIPGQALLNSALDGHFDLIVAGAYGHKGLKELMFGGATRYLLENSTVPVFMSH